MQILDFGGVTPNMDAARQQLLLLGHVYGKDPQGFSDVIGSDASFIDWQQYAATWPPSWATVEATDGSMLIVIEGTTSIIQGIQHLNGTFGRPFMDTGRFVHGFFDLISENFFDQLAPLRTNARRFVKWQLSGHSYGAAVAYLLGIRLKRWAAHEESNIKVMTFGEPRSFLADYNGAQPNVHHRIVSTNDIVTMVPPEAIGPIVQIWNAPIQWGQMPLPWAHFGTLTTLYPSGSRTDPTVPNPLPPGVKDNVPDAHYLPNYWQRLVLNAQLEGGTLPSEVDLKRMQTLIHKFPDLVITPELPSGFPGPDGRMVLIPRLERAEGFAVAVQPVVIRHTWDFVGQSGETWSEIYHLGTEGAEQSMLFLKQSLPQLDHAMIPNRLKFLWKGHFLRSIRASYVFGNKLSTARTYNVNGRAEGTVETNGADVTATSATWTLMGTSGAKRKVWFRGFVDEALERIATNGQGGFRNDTKTLIRAFVKSIADFRYGVMRRTKKKPVAIGLELSTTVVDGSLASNWSQVTTALPHGYTDGAQVILGQHSDKELPGLNGIYTIRVYPGQTSTFWIRYRTPSEAQVTSGMGYVREFVALPVDVFDPVFCEFFELTTRQTRNPLSRSRGASRARRRRLSV